MRMCSLILFIITFFVLTLEAQYFNIPWENNNRTFLLRLPSQYDASVEYPLIIAMHGGTGNAFNLENQSQLSIKAEEENFIVVYPEGLPLGILDIRTWNAGWCCGMASSTDIDDVGFINALIDTLLDDYSIDESRIYATGMSNGGFMSYRLACELPERIAAIAPVAATMSMVDCQPNRQVPIIHFHSYLDEAGPYLGGIGTGISSHYSPPLDSVLNAWANHNDCASRNDTIEDNSLYTKIEWNNCACNSQILQYMTYDGGHSWPGGMATPLGDPVSNNINANDLMWSFFESHSLECTTTSTSNFENISDIKLYPNPSKEIITIVSEFDMSSSKISIFELGGKKVFTSSGKHEIDISQLDAGAYILRIEFEEYIFVRKIIKID